MNRPYIICHMTQSIDGKVTGDFLSRPECENAIDIYYELNRNYKADAFACGRVTMETSFTGGFYPDLSEFEPITQMCDHVAKSTAPLYAVSFDRFGKLGWKSAEIVDEDPGYGGAHIIEVLTEKADPKYLSYLQSIGVSYIFASDLSVSLEKLKKLFGIEKLLLEGGSIINGAFLREDLVDELSLVVAPVVANENDKPLFSDSSCKSFKLTGSKNYENSVVFLKYDRIAR